MKMTPKYTVSLDISLSEEEAKWLESMMQYPLHTESFEDESEINNKMRTRFSGCFNALNKL